MNSFWKRLIAEDYIEDDSQVAGCFGGPYICKYRRKSKLLKKKKKNEETAHYSDDNKYTYYIKEMYEDWNIWLKLIRAGKKPLRVSAPLFWYRQTGSGELSRAIS